MVSRRNTHQVCFIAIDEVITVLSNNFIAQISSLQVNSIVGIFAVKSMAVKQVTFQMFIAPPEHTKESERGPEQCWTV